MLKSWGKWLLTATVLLLPRAASAGDTLVYYQSTGQFFAKDHVVVGPIAKGYSGAGDHKDNPKSQCIQDLGPIPVGTYTMGRIADVTHPDGSSLKSAIALTPDPKNTMCGRFGFYIHGESKAHPQWASGGCIIVGLEFRRKISSYTKLVVMIGKADPEPKPKPESKPKPKAR